MEIKEAVLVKVMPTKIWIESGMGGERVVMLQHEGCDAFDYATFSYDYRYTSNSGTMAAATALARSLGAPEPIEHRHRGINLPTAAELREQISELTDALAEIEGKTPNVEVSGPEGGLPPKGRARP